MISSEKSCSQGSTNCFSTRQVVGKESLGVKFFRSGIQQRSAMLCCTLASNRGPSQLRYWKQRLSFFRKLCMEIGPSGTGEGQNSQTFVVLSMRHLPPLNIIKFPLKINSFLSWNFYWGFSLLYGIHTGRASSVTKRCDSCGQDHSQLGPPRRMSCYSHSIPRWKLFWQLGAIAKNYTTIQLLHFYL